MQKPIIYTGLLTGLLSLFGCEPKHQSKAQAIITDSLKIEIDGEIKEFINSGFYNKEEVFAKIQDMFYNEALDKDWIKQVINKRYTYRITDQKAWEKETDFDRLAQVFDKLNASGIIALHNAGYTRQDGEGDTRELHEDLKGKGIKTRGYCFYHEQDINTAIDGHRLFLAFGDFEGNHHAGISIGKEIVAALHDKGFKIDWDGSIENRIEIVGFHWQKRFGNGNCSNERAIEFLSKQ